MYLVLPLHDSLVPQVGFFIAIFDLHLEDVNLKKSKRTG